MLLAVLLHLVAQPLLQDPAPAPVPANAPTYGQSVGCMFTTDRFLRMVENMPDADPELPAIREEARLVREHALIMAQSAHAAEGLTPEQAEQTARDAARFVLNLSSDALIETMAGCRAAFGTQGQAPAAAPAG